MLSPRQEVIKGILPVVPTAPWRQCKVLFLGAANSGTTTLIEKIHGSDPVEQRDPRTKVWKKDGVEFSLVDLSAKVLQYPLNQIYLLGHIAIVVLVFDASEEFYTDPHLVELFHSHRRLAALHSSASTPQYLVVGTHRDPSVDKPIFSTIIDMDAEIFFVNSAAGLFQRSGITAVRRKLTSLALSHFSPAVPFYYQELVSVIERLRREVDVIWFSKLMAELATVVADLSPVWMEAICRFFHDRGVIVWLPFPETKELVMLGRMQAEWFQEQPFQYLPKVLSGLRAPKGLSEDMLTPLFRIMQRLELAHPLNGPYWATPWALPGRAGIIRFSQSISQLDKAPNSVKAIRNIPVSSWRDWQRILFQIVLHFQFDPEVEIKQSNGWMRMSEQFLLGKGSFWVNDDVMVLAEKKSALRSEWLCLSIRDGRAFQLTGWFAPGNEGQSWFATILHYLHSLNNPDLAITVACEHCMSSDKGGKYYSFNIEELVKHGGRPGKHLVCPDREWDSSKLLLRTDLAFMAPDIGLPHVNRLDESEIDDLTDEVSARSVSPDLWRPNSKTALPIAIRSQHLVTLKDKLRWNAQVFLVNGWDHPNLLKLHGILLDPPRQVYELCSVDLRRMLLTRPYSWEVRLKILTDVARGMAYLHSRSPPVIHRDLISTNIYVNFNPEPISNAAFVSSIQAKVGGFDLAIYSPMALTETVNKAWELLAPEVIQEHPFYDHRSDVYSFAIFIWHCFHPTRLPYESKRSRDETAKLALKISSLSERYIETPDLKLELSDDSSEVRLKKAIVDDGLRPEVDTEAIRSGPTGLADLMQECWLLNPAKRPTFSQILERLSTIEQSTSPAVLHLGESLTTHGESD